MGIHDPTLVHAILDKVVENYFTDEALHKFEHRHDISGSLRAWLKMRIRGAATQVFRKHKKDLIGNAISFEDEIAHDSDDDDCPTAFGLTADAENDDDASWRRYIVFLALNEVRRKSEGTPLQFQSFVGVVYNGIKPAQLSEVLGISSLQISENVRAVKDKIKTALKRLDEKYPIDDLDAIDWKKLKSDAETAKEEIDALEVWFSRKVAEQKNKK